MASSHANAGGQAEIVQIAGDPQQRRFKLIVNIRAPHVNERGVVPTLEELQKLQAKTIGNWVSAMRSFLFDVEIENENNVSAIESLPPREDKSTVEASNYEPYVTVWNMDNHTQIGMNSNTRPREGADLAWTYVAGKDLFNKYRTNYGLLPVDAVQATKPVSQAPVGSPAKAAQDEQWLEQKTEETRQAPVQVGSNFPALGRSNIRQSKFLQGATTHLLLQEFVQGGGGADKYEKTVMIATEDFHRTAIQYEHKQKVAFKINGALTVTASQFNNQLQIRIPTNGGGIWVTIQPDNENAYDWKSLRDAIGLPKEKVHELAAGQQLFLSHDAYVVLECTSLDKQGNQRTNKDGEPVQYKNFYNLYYAPDYEDEVSEQSPRNESSQETQEQDDIPF